MKGGMQQALGEAQHIAALKCSWRARCEKLYQRLAATEALSTDRSSGYSLTPRGERLLRWLRERRKRALQ